MKWFRRKKKKKDLGDLMTVDEAVEYLARETGVSEEKARFAVHFAIMSGVIKPAQVFESAEILSKIN